ncbi:MAG: threonine transporter RhtB [Alteromonadaceae bacterium]|mgnify:FL=1|uniref:LysE family translocator n=1 Tax=Paraglaciecola chathamensis TaxID=368405 RepID=UPI000C47ADB1|nr:LysE family translocator [Paraglaciecola agarilytica]MBN26690.1 threonine transporter RhtB [Alteromonadaceae bacterium]|tara:strand:+ start:22036 stop:22683 length:648 start_codon:yes stop_codon:yes gene_type:complete
MHILNFEAFLLAITLLTLTPGIDTVLVIKNASRSGGCDGVVTSLGICLGLFVHATFSAVGISAILLQSAELFMAVKWVGAGYLIWLGVSALKAAFKGDASVAINATGLKMSNLTRSLKEGFLSNVLNPKTAVFYLAFLPQFIDPQHSPFAQAMSMAAIHFIIAMIWQCGLAGAVSSAKRFFASSTAMRWMEGVSGSVLVFLGSKLLLDDDPAKAN